MNWKAKAIVALMTALVLCFATAPALALTAQEYDAEHYESWEGYDSSEDYDDGEHYDVEFMKEYVRCGALPLNATRLLYGEYIDANDDEAYDVIKVTSYIKKGKGKYKKLKTRTAHETGELNDEEFFSHKTKKLSPNTKYTFKFVIKNVSTGESVVKYDTEWTTPKKIPAKNVKRNGNACSWRKVKKVKGYLVQYKHFEYAGKNKYGVDTFYWYYETKNVKKNKVVLNSNQKIVAVYPWVKHGKFYYSDKTEVSNLKAYTFGKYSYISDPIYR